MALQCGEKILGLVEDSQDTKWLLKANLLIAQALLTMGEAIKSRAEFIKTYDLAKELGDKETQERVENALQEINHILSEYQHSVKENEIEASNLPENKVNDNSNTNQAGKYEFHVTLSTLESANETEDNKTSIPSFNQALVNELNSNYSYQNYVNHRPPQSPSSLTRQFPKKDKEEAIIPKVALVSNSPELEVSSASRMTPVKRIRVNNTQPNNSNNTRSNNNNNQFGISPRTKTAQTSSKIPNTANESTFFKILKSHSQKANTNAISVTTTRVSNSNNINSGRRGKDETSVKLPNISSQRKPSTSKQPSTAISLKLLREKSAPDLRKSSNMITQENKPTYQTQYLKQGQKSKSFDYAPIRIK